MQASQRASLIKLFIWEYPAETDSFNLASYGAKGIDNAASVNAVPVRFANFQANRESLRNVNL